ncbi:MAG: SusD/RagB family nutrient-binding outer membrane lipoprotein [Bacteroidales bacterium]|nr:SusD/RagB family nutrient-binding outer membrane lipoprotein [Bacteroidales bacterium]
MRTYRITTALLIITSAILAFSCKKDLEEMNKDPQGFTTASHGSLFNGIIQSLLPGWNEQFYVNNEILYKQTQQAALTKEAWGNFTIGTEEMWTNYYGALTQIRELERRFSEMDNSAELSNMQAMLKTALAYKTFKLTDVFGDIPFFDAGYGFQDLEQLHPEFDRQETIYKFLLQELVWVDENISDTATMEEPFATFAGFDKLFNGDMKMWRKFANSLSLRHAMRMAEKDPLFAGEIIKNIIENERPVLYGYDFLTPKLESACMWPAAMGFSNESMNWSFREHNNLRMGSNIWHQLSKHDSADGSGIIDPRAYIFFEGNNANKWVAFPQIPVISTPASGGIPYGTHRDQVGAFGIKGETCIYSPFNYYVIRDEDYMPIILITGAEVHFIKAEAYFRGIGVAVDQSKADGEYMNGINTSVEWWKNVAENSKLPVSGMSFGENISIPAHLNAASVLFVFGSWNASSDEEKLAFIYTQRWLDAFRQPWEAYALARRTGFTPHEGEPISHYRMPYPPSEVEYNSANWASALANQGGGDTPDFKIWWIP